MSGDFMEVSEDIETESSRAVDKNQMVYEMNPMQYGSVLMVLSGSRDFTKEGQLVYPTNPPIRYPTSNKHLPTAGTVKEFKKNHSLEYKPSDADPLAHLEENKITLINRHSQWVREVQRGLVEIIESCGGRHVG